MMLALNVIWDIALQFLLISAVTGHPLNGASARANEANEVRNGVLYRFTTEHRQTTITSSSPNKYIQLKSHIPFYGFYFDSVLLSLNGYIGFSNTPVSQGLPFRFPNNDWPDKEDPAFIAPYYTLATIGEAENAEAATPPGLYFKEHANIGEASNDQDTFELQEAIRSDIQEEMIGATDFSPKHILIFTWMNVTFAGSSQLKQTNTYQMVLATDEQRSYVIFNYDNLTWTTSTAASGGSETGLGGNPAFVGFNAGNGTQSFEYKPYSQSSRVLQLSRQGNMNGFPGRHMFRIDEQIISGVCNYQPDQQSSLILSPETGHMLGGTVVNITGPCFEPTHKIKVQFHDKEVTCIYENRNLATCVSPSVNTVGFIDVTVMLQSSSIRFHGKFYIDNPIFNTRQVWFDDRTLFNNLEIKSFNVYWSKSNLSKSNNNESENVYVNLYGYGESGFQPDLVFIRQLKEEENSGFASIDVTQFANETDIKTRHLKIGLIQVTSSYHAGNDGILTAALWSSPIPLSWYFHSQWTKHVGPNWAEQFCKEWTSTEERRPPLSFASLPACPCTMEDALRDEGRFAQDPNCDWWGRRDCDDPKKMAHCVMSAQPTSDGAGQHCCYGFDGQLLTVADTKMVGHPWRAHPFGLYPYDDVFGKTPGLSHWHQDLWGQYTCCLWEKDGGNYSTCDVFLKLRPPNYCDGYRRPKRAIVFGDPHFITFDGLQYSFNGKGEYSLLHVKNPQHVLDAQVRFEQYIDYGFTTYGNNYSAAAPTRMQATILTAVAVKDNVSSTVEIRQRQMEARWRYRLTIIVDGHNIYLDRPQHRIYNFKGVTVYTQSDILNQSHVVVAFPSGAAIEVSENRGFLATVVSLPHSYMNSTRALLGNWSNDVSEDFRTPSGLQINSNSTFQQIYEPFGLQWAVSDLGLERPDSKTIFHHDNGRTSSYYFDPTFQPEFQKQPQISSSNANDVRQLCGVDDNEVYQCRFDYVVSRNRDMAMSTRTFFDNFMMMGNDPQPEGRCPPIRPGPNVHISTTDRLVGTIVHFGCLDGFRFEGTYTLTCQDNRQWSPLENGEPQCLEL